MPASSLCMSNTPWTLNSPRNIVPSGAAWMPCTNCSAKQELPPAPSSSSGSATRRSTWSKASPISPMCSRISVTASAKSSSSSTLKPRAEEWALTGLTQNGKSRSMLARGSSAKGSKSAKPGTHSGTDFCCSSRLQPLCSLFSRLVSEGEGRLCSAASSVAITLTGKSQCAMIASMLPSKASRSARASCISWSKSRSVVFTRVS